MKQRIHLGGRGGLQGDDGGEEQIVTGRKTRLQVAAAHVTPAGMLAENAGQASSPDGRAEFRAVGGWRPRPGRFGLDPAALGR